MVGSIVFRDFNKERLLSSVAASEWQTEWVRKSTKNVLLIDLGGYFNREVLLVTPLRALLLLKVNCHITFHKRRCVSGLKLLLFYLALI